MFTDQSDKILVVNTSREFQKSNPQNGSEFDNNGPYMDETTLSNMHPLNLQIEPMNTNKFSPYKVDGNLRE